MSASASFDKPPEGTRHWRLHSISQRCWDDANLTKNGHSGSHQNNQSDAAGGVVERYAIGGSVGATFYLEPGATLDLVIFISFKPQRRHLLLSAQPVFDYLKKRGGVMEGEHIVIAGWPVQFLPPNTPLVEEALAQAVEKLVTATRARVFTAEHLAAIALQTGRAKDKARLLQFVEAGALNAKAFQDLLTRHGLKEAWTRFERQFLGP